MTTGRINQVGTFIPTALDRRGAVREQSEFASDTSVRGCRFHGTVRSTATEPEFGSRFASSLRRASPPNRNRVGAHRIGMSIRRRPNASSSERGSRRSASSRERWLKVGTTRKRLQSKNFLHRILVRASSSALDRETANRLVGEPNERPSQLPNLWAGPPFARTTDAKGGGTKATPQVLLPRRRPSRLRPSNQTAPFLQGLRLSRSTWPQSMATSGSQLAFFKAELSTIRRRDTPVPEGSAFSGWVPLAAYAAPPFQGLGLSLGGFGTSPRSSFSGSNDARAEMLRRVRSLSHRRKRGFHGSEASSPHWTRFPIELPESFDSFVSSLDSFPD